MNNSGIISCLERLVKHIHVVRSNIRFFSKSKITVNKLTSKNHSCRKETFRLPKGSKPDYFISYMTQGAMETNITIHITQIRTKDNYRPRLDKTIQQLQFHARAIMQRFRDRHNIVANLSLTIDSHRHRLLLCCCSSCLFYFIHFGKYISIKLCILLVVFSHFVLQNFVLNLDIPGNIHQTNINSNKNLNWNNFFSFVPLELGT